jgi:hypothetical protein
VNIKDTITGLFSTECDNNTLQIIVISRKANYKGPDSSPASVRER